MEYAFEHHQALDETCLWDMEYEKTKDSTPDLYMNVQGKIVRYWLCGIWAIDDNRVEPFQVYDLIGAEMTSDLVSMISHPTPDDVCDHCKKAVEHVTVFIEGGWETALCDECAKTVCHSYHCEC